jgi:predicted transcriptional regulator
LKPVFLLPQLWQKHLVLEVKIEQQDPKLSREIRKVHAISSSRVMSSVFLLIVRGTGSPKEIARLTGRSKYAVSLQISKLKNAGLIVLSKRTQTDLRQRNYEVSYEKLLQIFQQDYAFELEFYRNHLLSESFGEIRGSIEAVELVVVGSGRLGLVREIAPDVILKPSPAANKVSERFAQLYLEFQSLMKEYFAERGRSTILDYFLSFYRELSLNHSRLPEASELGRFFEFVDSTIFKIKPIEELWSIAARKGQASAQPRKINIAPQTLESVKLFSEAGRMDSAGRYILNADARSYITPGVKVRVYPSYTFMT